MKYSPRALAEGLRHVIACLGPDMPCERIPNALPCPNVRWVCNGDSCRIRLTEIAIINGAVDRKKRRAR